MNRVSFFSFLFLSLCLVSTAAPLAAQPVGALDYLLEGADRARGGFTGRLTLHPDGEGHYRADRRVQFLKGGEELLGGRGQRVDHELRVLFEQTVGAAGRLERRTAQHVRLLGDFDGKDDKYLATRTLGKSDTKRLKTRTKGWGFRVFPVERERAATTPSYSYKQFKGVPFIKGEGDAHEVDPNDVRQGSLGDCYFMAGISAVARTDPHRIKSMIETNADGTFSVYLWKHDVQWEEEVVDKDGFYTPTVKATVIVVDDKFPTSFGTSPAFAKSGDSITEGDVEIRELWPMILEKAYAKHKKSYSTIEGGWASTPMSFFSGEDVVKDYVPQKLTEDRLRKILTRAFEKGYPVSMGVPKRHPELHLVGNHYYFMGGLDEHGNVKLLNPWGSSHPPKALTMADIKAGIDMIHVGKF